MYFICQSWYVWSCDELSDYLSELPCSHTSYKNILYPYEQISDDKQEHFYNLTDVYILDIGISGPYEQIFDELQSYLSELPDSHTLDI